MQGMGMHKREAMGEVKERRRERKEEGKGSINGLFCTKDQLLF